MAKTTKYFKNAQALATWLDNGMLPSGVLAVVLNEDGDDIDEIQVSTNGVTKHFEKYVTVGDQMAERLQEELEEANATIQAQETQILDLQQDVEEWHDKWDKCYQDLQTANETIATQQETITTQQETIATLNVTITQKDAIIAEKDVTIASQSATIQDLQSQLATANATIASLQNDITSYDNQLQVI